MISNAIMPWLGETCLVMVGLPPCQTSTCINIVFYRVSQGFLMGLDWDMNEINTIL